MSEHVTAPPGSWQEPDAASLNGVPPWSLLAGTTPAWVAGSLAVSRLLLTGACEKAEAPPHPVVLVGLLRVLCGC